MGEFTDTPKCDCCNYYWCQGFNKQEPHTCPVCYGVGTVDGEFYNRNSQTWTNSGGTEVCRSCSGRGIVWG